MRRLLGVVLLVAASCYLNALDNPFVFDDVRVVVQNPSLRDPSNIVFVLAFERFRPLTNVTYAIDRTLWGSSPLGFHATNLGLHLAVVALTLRLLARREEDLFLGGLVAALVAVHPLMNQAVGYVSGRSALLCAVFFLGALLAFRRWVETGHGAWLAALLGLWGLSLASRETGGMLPVVLLAYDGLVLAPGEEQAPARRSRLLRLHLPLLAIVALGGLVRVIAFATQERPIGLDEVQSNVVTQLGVTWRYLGLLLLPVGQSIVHHVSDVGLFDPGGLPAGLALAGLVALAWRVRDRWPLVTFGTVWTLAVHVPTLLVPLHERMAEQRTYLPNLGALMAVGTLLLALAPRLARAAGDRADAPALAGVALVALLGGVTVWRNAVWNDAVGLWREATRVNPWYALAWNNLGSALLANGERSDARAAYERAAVLDPNYGDAHANLAIILAEDGALDAARRLADQAIEATPYSRNGWTVRASIRVRQGELVGALEDCHQALVRDAWSAMPYVIRGDILRRQSRWQEAITEYGRALEIDPRSADALAHRGLARLWLDDVAGAQADFEAALAVDPDEAYAHAGIGRVLAKRGDGDAARVAWRHALELDPTNPAALFGLALDADERHDTARALAIYQRLVELHPGFAVAHYNLGVLQAAGGDAAGARKSYDRVVALDPRHAGARLNRGRLRARDGDLVGAAEDLDVAVRMAPDDVRARLSRAEVRRQRGDVAGALQDCDHALQVDARSLQGWVLRGRLLAQSSEHRPAIEAFEKVLALAGPDDKALADYARRLRQESMAQLRQQ